MKENTLINTAVAWVPDSFKLESNLDLGKINIKDISLYLSDKQKTDSIKGEDLLKELEGKNPLGSAVLRYLLDNPKLIPEEWKGKYVYFNGTILRNPVGNRYALYLYWYDGQGHWGCGWLENDWLTDNPSAVLAKENIKIEEIK